MFFIYESRPNVTADASAICVKSGNAVILRGGKEARHSSQALVEILQRIGVDYGLPAAAIQLVETADRAAVGHFLAMPEFIDVAIPRGGKGLITRVVREAQMPVIKHFDGNCHVYVDKAADLPMAIEIVVNSKCQRMGVCNACESLLVHEKLRRNSCLGWRMPWENSRSSFAVTRPPRNSYRTPWRQPKRIGVPSTWGQF